MTGKVRAIVRQVSIESEEHLKVDSSNLEEVEKKLSESDRKMLYALAEYWEQKRIEENQKSVDEEVSERVTTNSKRTKERNKMDTEVKETESTYIDPKKIDEWLRNFQLKHGDTMMVDDSVLTHLACELCNDLPLGYGASHRLANLIFCHINTSKYSSDAITSIDVRTDDVLAAERKLLEAYTAYKEKINQVICLLDLRTTKTPIIF